MSGRDDDSIARDDTDPEHQHAGDALNALDPPRDDRESARQHAVLVRQHAVLVRQHAVHDPHIASPAPDAAAPLIEGPVHEPSIAFP